ncbi:uncharacterized protein [Triticum aestivum]|uniref:uncharacterized protein isoform X1 n=1 Tax=Triticum aestivum TaxID=4565 RepID=UPI001D02AC97|nr:uncharacterized protein LOC123069463 isoform X1 [Triticum aestivum]
MRGVRARPPVSSFSSTLELVKTTVCIFTGRLCSNAMELVELDPLAPVTEVQGVGLRVPTVMEDFKEFIDDVMSGDGSWGEEEEILSHWVSEVRSSVSRCNARASVGSPLQYASSREFTLSVFFIYIIFYIRGGTILPAYLYLYT